MLFEATPLAVICYVIELQETNICIVSLEKDLSHKLPDVYSMVKGFVDSGSQSTRTLD